MVALLLGMTPMSLAATDTWTQKADMPTSRLALASSVVDGKIYAIGGRPDGALTTEYDPTTDTWTTKTRMPTARFCLATSVVDEKIYAIGGTPGPNRMFRTVEVYDPQTDTWTKKADMPRANCFFSANVVDGKIYAIGGIATLWSTHLRSVYEYDPQTDIWTQKADMPTERNFLSTAVVDGKIYAIGGALASKTMLSTVEVYDPATDTWTTKTPMPTARIGHTSTVIDEKIYVIGGGTHTPSRGFSVVEVYDPATDTWTTKTDMPAQICWHSTGVVDEKIYVFGGSPSGYEIHPPGFSTVYEYDATPPLVVDFNGDGTVDIKDLLRLIESWGQDDPLCDIAPPPFGDGIIDAMDLELLMSHWEQPVDDPTLIAHWALDEAEGITAYDSAGVNDAFLVGGTEWQPDNGQINGALHLDGISGCVVTYPTLNPANGSFSIFTWINGGAAGQVVVSQQRAANWLTVDAEGNLMSELNGIGRSTGPLFSETVITDGEWHRIGFVWDEMYRMLYVDDVLVAEDIQVNLQDSFGGLYIGTGKTMESGTYWSGLIDDVRIYNRVVSP
jgi:N-acetylneuraminic acid mutarotase